jgi:hypothetical protein
MALQHLRSSTADKRPTPAAMSDGQLALNTNLASPGLFFKDSNGDSVKIGPVHVGTTAPNVSPAVGGEAGNSKGEQWLDTTGGVYVFKIYDGTAWRSETGTFVDVNGDTMTGALGIIAGSAASPGLFFSGDTNSGLYSPGADQVAVATNGTGRLFVDANGNVLINDSASVTSNVTGYVRIRQANAASDTSIAIINAQNSDANATVKIQAGQFTRRGGEIVFGRENGGDLTTTTLADGYIAFSPVLNNTNTQAVRITSAGLVGIGTSAPTELLHLSGASATALVAASSGVGSIQLTRGTTAFQAYASTSACYIGTTSATDFQLRANNSEAARITSAGLVGIGTSSAVSVTGFGTLLTVANNAGGGIVLQDANTTIGYRNKYIASVDGEIHFGKCADDGTSPTTQVLLDHGGRVGVGTTSPDAELDVNGRIYLTEGNELAWHNGAGAQAARIYGSSTDELRFDIGSTSSRALTIDSSGRLLAGTSTSRAIGGAAAGDFQIEVSGTKRCATFVRNGGTAIVTLGATGAAGIGNTTIVANGNAFGSIEFAGADGTDVQTTGASISAFVDGTPGANDMPGRLVFSTTADGASTPTERMRISSSGTTTITGGGTGTNNNFLAQNSSSARILALRDDGYTRYGTATNSPYNFGVSTSTKAMFMDNGGGFGFNSSIRASKTNIETAPTADWINNLDVVTFNYRLKNEDGTYSDEAEAELRWGVIAENAEQVNPDFCSYDSSGKLDGFHYDRMIPVLLKAIQELKVEVADLKAQLS